MISHSLYLLAYWTTVPCFCALLQSMVLAPLWRKFAGPPSPPRSPPSLPPSCQLGSALSAPPPSLQSTAHCPLPPNAGADVSPDIWRKRTTKDLMGFFSRILDTKCKTSKDLLRFFSQTRYKVLTRKWKRAQDTWKNTNKSFGSALPNRLKISFAQ